MIVAESLINNEIVMTPEEIERWHKKIDLMTQEECAHLQRYAPPGHPLFDSKLPLYEYFAKHFKTVGGMTPTVSKKIGWGE